MLEIQSLECVRDDRLLFSDLSFTLAESEVLQIEGANGCGKTSLLRIICGLRLAEAGKVLWCGESIRANREDFYANMVYIGHLPCIKGDLTVLENVRALLDTRSLSVSNQVIEAALAKVGLESYDDVPGKALKKGELISAMAHDLQTSKKFSREVIDWISEEIHTELSEHGVFRWGGVGTLKVKNRKGKKTIEFTPSDRIQKIVHMHEDG